MSKAQEVINLINEADDELKIENPNSSGQGYSGKHKSNPYHAILTKFGFEYSHSTPVTMLGGKKYLHHTYQKTEPVGYVVSAYRNSDWDWKWEGRPMGYYGKVKRGYTGSSLDQYLSNLKKRNKI